MIKGEKRVALISLGCPKNLVDSEYMSEHMRKAGLCLVEEPSVANVIIVNTCGFIESAKTEAIETILSMADYKNEGCCQFLIVTGCLAQRYSGDIQESLPEVDAVLGTGAYGEIVSVIQALYEGLEGKATHQDEADSQDCQALQVICRTPDQSAHSLDHTLTHRIPSTAHYAYLKLAEGCSNACAYCAIPGIRGKMVSRSEEAIVAEARDLIDQGYDELILIAQDTTRYGVDLAGERRLVPLMEALLAIHSDVKLRLMYCYSDGITDELIDLMVREPRILRYVEMPIQHAADPVLKRMRRRDTQAELRDCIERLRHKLPDVTLRTTVMVAFPEESEEEFNVLKTFLNEMRFDRLGCFIFSPEEGTAAYDMPQTVSAEVAQLRYEQIMQQQQRIATELAHKRIGQIYDVLIEGHSDDGIFYKGRSYAEAPEIDPVFYILAQDAPLEMGKRYAIKVIESGPYELTGVTV